MTRERHSDALNSSTNRFGVYHASPLPIVDVMAKSSTAAIAAQLASATVEAFATWIRQQQAGRHSVGAADHGPAA